MGDTISARPAVTLQAWLPGRADITLVHNGRRLKQVLDQQSIVEIVKAPGTYRLEAKIRYRGRLRTWILSNPIYLNE
jgi:hypothetical protein